MIKITLQDMPYHIRSFVKENIDDSYTIIINSRLNIEQQHNAALHEMSHIVHDDLHSDEQADALEFIRH